MASWQQIEQEVLAWAQANPGQNAIDPVRKQKLNALQALTGRPVLIYAADFLNPKLPPELADFLYINLRDKDNFVDLTQNVTGDAIDLLIQSPGGSAEATESIVTHLRSRFTDIRVLVPGTAKSAATMLAMAANELALDEVSELGPTDPQMIIGNRPSPAGAIRKQFQMAVETLQQNPANIVAWAPILQQYGPSLLVECENHINLSIEVCPGC